MKRLMVGALLSVALVATSGVVRADDNYKETKTADGSDVVFKDADQLNGAGLGPVGAQLSGFHPPKRFQLMHPRVSFVPQMLKTVENM